MQVSVRPICRFLLACAMASLLASTARAESCGTDFSDDDVIAVVKEYWRGDRISVPAGRYRLSAGKQLVGPDGKKVSPWTLSTIGGAVAAGWAAATLDGSPVAPGAAGDTLARAIGDGAEHTIVFAVTDIGHAIARKAG